MGILTFSLQNIHLLTHSFIWGLLFCAVSNTTNNIHLVFLCFDWQYTVRATIHIWTTPHHPALQSVWPCGTKLVVRRQRGWAPLKHPCLMITLPCRGETAGRLRQLGCGTAPFSTGCWGECWLSAGILCEARNDKSKTWHKWKPQGLDSTKQRSDY